MACPGQCAPGEQVWLVDNDLKVLKRVKVDTRCADSLFAPAMALDQKRGSLVVGSCELNEAFIVDQSGTKRRIAMPKSGAIAVVDDLLIALSDPMTVIDLETGRVRARLSAGGAAIEAIRHGESLYVLHAGEDESSVTEVDFGTWKVRRKIELSDGRECMAIYSDTLLLTGGGVESLVIVDLQDGSMRTVSVPSTFCELMVDASRRVGYMPFESETEWGLLALDMSDFREQARLSIGDSSVLWAVFDDRGALYAEVASELVKVRVQ